MLRQHEWIDLIIPRGSNAFVRYIMQNSEIPVLGHAEGLCHVYVDDPCDIGLAVRVTVDSKAQNLSVCNAAERCWSMLAWHPPFCRKQPAAARKGHRACARREDARAD